MAQSAVVIDPNFMKHDTGPSHPESPKRLKPLLDLTAELEGESFQILRPRPALMEDIGRCHQSEYIELVRSTSKRNRYALDGDTVTCSDSFGIALLAAGGFLNLLDSIASSDSRNGMALVRPPGHHALRGHAMGFCLFNTVAIGAEYLKYHYGAKRILIMDWDVHHGNGTQAAFYQDPTVLYISTHQFPYYPGSGATEETGEGQGEGYTINIPLPAGCGDEEYLRVFKDVVIPCADRYEPEWILVSAGFDPHRRDPLGGMEVTERGFAIMASSLLDAASKHASDKIAFLLEGGYDLMALKRSVSSVLEKCAGHGKSEIPTETGGEQIEPLIRTVLNIREKYR